MTEPAENTTSPDAAALSTPAGQKEKSINWKRLKKRVAIGTTLLGLSSGFLYLDFVYESAICFMILVAVLMPGALYEFYSFLGKKSFTPLKWMGVITVIALIGYEYGVNHFEKFAQADYFTINQLMSFIFFFGIFLYYLFFRDEPHVIENIAFTIFGIAYIWGLGRFTLYIRFYHGEMGAAGQEVGRALVFFLILVAKGNDVFAYFGGTFLGRHKLIPRVSPGKTWEGSICGFFGGIVIGLVIYYVSCLKLQVNVDKGLTLSFIILAAAVVGVAGQLGDLVESLLKRKAGVKDSSNLIPEYGGVLDLVDSLLLAGPALYFLVYFCTKIQFRMPVLGGG
ncbi:MAG: CDP-archaeol synthase [Planctomycetota bacterium]|nr:MAG: CDP-archaeol synthase [Planctomycetota bacterium]